MGLTIHYDLETDVSTKREALALVTRLHKQAKKLPFKEVLDIICLSGDECDFNKNKDDSLRWLLIQSQKYVDCNNGRHISVIPKNIIAFSTFPGDGCEDANFGLCSYPKHIVTDLRGNKVSTGAKGWSWESFCKTQYASNPKCGGVSNFIRCHLTVLSLLEQAKKIGILKEVTDEGDFWEKRDIKALVQEVASWNTMIANMVGQFSDHMKENGIGDISAAILEFPNFEHLEADESLKKNKRISR